jgi:Ca2+-binding RTX toxin-like protein
MYSGGNTSSSDITDLSGFSASANLAVVGSASADTMNLNIDRASTFTGNWTISLAAGNDTLSSAKLKNGDSIDMGAGDDTISLMLTGSNGTNTIANANLAKLDGGAGWDTLSFYESGASTTALSFTTANATNFEGISGSSGAETITGNSSDNYLNGGGGSSDTANDTLNGEAGNDVVMAVSACSGCSGDKYAFVKQYWPYANNYTTEGTFRNGSATYWDNDGDHTLNGGAGDDILIGAEGEDTLTGGAGQDNLIGGRGIDTFVIKAGDGSTTLANADVIQDFKDGTDLIGMTGGLQYTDLIIEQGTGNYADLILIRIRDTNEYLAVIHTQGQNGAGNITSSNIDSNDFTAL